MMETTRGLFILYTGDGKGKTTAALGLLMRALGHSMRVKILQFMKASTSYSGEYRTAAGLGVEILQLGGGFTWVSNAQGMDARLAKQAWELARAEISAGFIDMLILDEITYPLQLRWLDVDEVLREIGHRPHGMHIVMTGRAAPEKLIAAADLVTEMREVKHPFKQGVWGQAGIEY